MVSAGSSGSVSFINELFLCKITPCKNYKQLINVCINLNVKNI